MGNILVHAHSGLRWIVLILLLTAIVKAFANKSKNSYTKSDKMLNLFTMISIHIQITIGLIMLFFGEKKIFHEGWMQDKISRFFVMEHALIMLVAMILITIGRKKAEKKATPNEKHKTIAIWYTIVLVLILAAIPWPGMRNLGAGWF
jgi:heme/copper-type cytochrome/quinol oxidase subunit 2